ncbi:MAG: HEAT repeat domain-containing protein [Candidatus Wallbacteria bacterium]|nr:HEAT repeat domain-containing protein [Candidatus Wallbacteria bacterium]
MLRPYKEWNAYKYPRKEKPMKKNHTIVLAVIVVSIAGIMFFSGGRKGEALATPPGITQAPVAQPKTPPPAPQPSATNEIAQAAMSDSLPGTGEIALSGGTEEIDLEKIVWAREYLRKYKGKIDNAVLTVLNKLIKEVSNKGFVDLHGMEFIIDNKLKIIDPLIDISKDETLDYFRYAVIQVLGQVKDARVEKTLITLSDKSEIFETRAIAARSLNSISSSGAFERFVEIASDENDDHREIALLFLNKDDKRSIDLLHDILEKADDASTSELAACSYALGAYGKNHKSTLLLTKVIENINNDPQVRGNAILSLSLIDPATATRFILEGLHSPVHLIRFNSISAASHVKNQDVVNELVEILLDNNAPYHFRGDALEALKKQDNKEFINIIIDNFTALDDYGAVLCSFFYTTNQNIKFKEALYERMKLTKDTYCADQIQTVLDTAN